MVLDIAFDIHRRMKREKSLMQIQSDYRNSAQSETTTDPQFLCPHCSRPTVASNFARHLDKCMGVGKNVRSVRKLPEKDYSKLDNGEQFELEEVDDQDGQEDKKSESQKKKKN